ncbi:MAG: NAD(P)H-dependent oxidoreductase [Bacteroidia bacterium]|nr:NAD(P)H-dependent oxidoreductase [Bacteroidia bacterium]
MKVSIISSSPRTRSNSLRVAKAVARVVQAKGEHQVSVVDFAGYDIPLYNQGEIDPDNLTPFQQQLVNAMTGSAVIILVVPEYNWTMPAELANFIHRMGDKPFLDLFNNKVFAFVGVSTGKGGRQPVVQLTYILGKIISFFELDTLVSSKLFESHFTKEAIDENGNSLGNIGYDTGLEKFVNYTLRTGKRWLSA